MSMERSRKTSVGRARRLRRNWRRQILRCLNWLVAFVCAAAVAAEAGAVVVVAAAAEAEAAAAEVAAGVEALDRATVAEPRPDRYSLSYRAPRTRHATLK